MIKPLIWKRTLHASLSNGRVCEDWRAVNNFVEYRVWSSASGKYFVKAHSMVKGNSFALLIREQHKSLAKAKQRAKEHWYSLVSEMLA